MPRNATTIRNYKSTQRLRGLKMADETMVEKAGVVVGVGLAAASDVSGAIKTAFDTVVTAATKVLKKAPAKKTAKKAVANRAAKKAPAKKTAAKKSPAKKTAAKESTAKKAAKKAVKTVPAKKAAKKSVKKPAKKTGRWLR
jgi:hypothetical protein